MKVIKYKQQTVIFYYKVSEERTHKNQYSYLKLNKNQIRT